MLRLELCVMGMEGSAHVWREWVELSVMSAGMDGSISPQLAVNVRAYYAIYTLV